METELKKENRKKWTKIIVATIAIYAILYYVNKD
jgi:hypothetical protein